MGNVNLESSTKVRLLEFAILCFAKKGFDATSIREIAKKAKANSALVHYYFGGKTGLYKEALRHILSCRPLKTVSVSPCLSHQNARVEAIRTLKVIIANMLHELMACSGGSELDKACLLLVTRELQDPREDVTLLILEYLRPFHKNILDCIKTIRPELDQLTAMNCVDSIIGQMTHLPNNLALIRLFRNEPDYPGDLLAVVRHITEFSLRGIGVP